MRNLCLRRALCLWGAVLVLVSMASRLGSAQTQTGGSAPTPSRTAWGDPNLQGTWDNRTITPLERPGEFAERESLTAAEASAYEALTAETAGQ